MELKTEYYWGNSPVGEFSSEGFSTEADAIADANQWLLENQTFYLFQGKDVKMNDNIFKIENVIELFHTTNFDLLDSENNIPDIEFSNEIAVDLEDSLNLAFSEWRKRHLFGRSGRVDIISRVKMKTLGSYDEMNLGYLDKMAKKVASFITSMYMLLCIFVVYLVFEYLESLINS